MLNIQRFSFFFLNDRDEQTKMVALSLLGKIPDKDYNFVIGKVKKDEYTNSKLRHAIEYFDALKANNIELLKEIVNNTSDESLKRVELLRSS